MNKRLAHILGVFVLVIFAFIFYDGWFHPEVPPALQKDFTNSRQTEDLTASEAEKQKAAETPQVNADGSTTITLTSLTSGDGSRYEDSPVSSDFSNSQEISHGNPSKSHGIQLESLAVQQNTETSQRQKLGNVTPPPQKIEAKVWIQAGSFGKRDNAEGLARMLRAKKFSVSVETAEVNGTVYNRVYVGPIVEKDVDNTLNQLLSLGVQARRITR